MAQLTKAGSGVPILSDLEENTWGGQLGYDKNGKRLYIRYANEINKLGAAEAHEISYSGSLSGTTVQDALDDLEATLNNEISGNLSGEDWLSGLISAEVAARISGDNALLSGLSGETAARISGDNTLQSGLESEISGRVAAVSGLYSTASGWISAEVYDRDQAIKAAKLAMQEQIPAVMTKTDLITAVDKNGDPLDEDQTYLCKVKTGGVTDEGLWEYIGGSTGGPGDIANWHYYDDPGHEYVDTIELGTAISGANATISGWISAEVAARISGDNSLTSGLNTEISGRISGDNFLSGNLAETSGKLSGKVDITSTPGGTGVITNTNASGMVFKKTNGTYEDSITLGASESSITSGGIALEIGHKSGGGIRGRLSITQSMTKLSHINDCFVSLHDGGNNSGVVISGYSILMNVPSGYNGIVTNRDIQVPSKATALRNNDSGKIWYATEFQVASGLAVTNANLSGEIAARISGVSGEVARASGVEAALSGQITGLMTSKANAVTTVSGTYGENGNARALAFSGAFIVPEITFDNSGNFVSGREITLYTPQASGAWSGNASSATKLANSRLISLSTDATGSGSFDGTAALTIATTISNGAITNAKIASGAVSAGSIASGAVTSGSITSGHVLAGSLATAAVTNAKIASGAVTNGSLASGSVSTLSIASGAVTAGSLATAAVTNAKIASGAISNLSIASGAVSTLSIASGAVTTGSIADGAIMNADVNASAAIAISKLATPGSIQANLASTTAANPLAGNIGVTGVLPIANGGTGAATVAGNGTAGKALISVASTTASAPTWRVLAATDIPTLNQNTTGSAATLTTSRVISLTGDATGSGSFNGGGNLAISTAIGAGKITTAMIASGAVTVGSIGTSAVGTDELVALAVTNAKIASGAVSTLSLADAAVTTAKITSGAVTAGSIGTAAVTTDEISGLAVTTAKIADLNVTTAKIAASAVTNAKMANMAANTIKGNNTASAAAPADISVTNAKTLLQIPRVYDDTVSTTAEIALKIRIVAALPSSPASDTMYFVKE